MIHLYYGDGKGKTTCAIGLSVRSLGNNIPVIFVQFLKNREAGEISALKKLGATVIRGKSCDKFTFQMTEEEKKQTKKICEENFEKAIELCKTFNSNFLIVFDEICAALNNKMLDEEKIFKFLQNPPSNSEIVLTGRNPPQAFLEICDYITEFKKEKHPFDKEIKARQGVEF